MDITFLSGIGAVASAIIVFVGSIVLLLSMVLGLRLAYFVTATVTLAFLLIMGVVWSLNPLGPTGPLPEWNGIAAGDEGDELDFGPANTYPESPWQPFAEDEDSAAKKAEIEGAASSALEDAVTDGQVENATDPGDLTVNADLTRGLEQGGTEYGAVTFEPGLETEATGNAVVVLEFDPGDPLGPPRQIIAGIAVLFGLHLFGLSRSERKAKKVPQTT